MDLRFQSSKWAGNIYKRFEALCQEVDDIVNQGTAEFVENHMQTVGENIKKTCIDAVLDLLPSIMVENGIDESQASNLRDNNSFVTYLKPRIDMTEKCAIADSSDNRNEQVPDLLRTFPISGTSLPQHVNVLNLENTDTQTVQKDSLTFSMQRKNNEEKYLIKQEDCLHPDNSIKENVIEKESFDSKILTCLAEAEDFSKACFLPKSNERNHGNEIPGASCASLAGNDGISRTEKDRTTSSTLTDEFHGVSDVSSSMPSSEAILYFAKSSEETRKINPRYDVPSRTSIYNEGFIPTVTNEVAKGQVKIDCLLENRLLQYFHANRQIEEEGPALPNIPAELKSTEKHGSPHKGESSDKSGAESVMETIDLSDEVKLDESRVIVDSKLLSTASSFWPNSRRSYKKLLKDAFTSRRRLRKEYEQLSILYGDFDTVTDRQSNPTVLPNTAIATDLKKISSDDHEWELL